MAHPSERTVGSGTTLSPRDRPANNVGRTLNVLLGIWLFISAFLWQHNYAQFTNTWACGVAVVVLALIAVGVPAVRFLNTLLAIWLFISAFALGQDHLATTWNNALVAIAIFILSLVGTAPGTLRTPRRPEPA